MHIVFYFYYSLGKCVFKDMSLWRSIFLFEKIKEQAYFAVKIIII